MNDYSGLILDGLRLTRNSIYIEIKYNFTNIDNINESFIKEVLYKKLFSY